MNKLTQMRIAVTVDQAMEKKYAVFQKNLLWSSVFNLLVLALAGLLLRGYPVFQLSLLSYKNVLHAHSHFAFGGWLTPVLLFLVLKYFPELKTSNTYKHWRNSIVLLLTAAYGMLFSFPFQGYGPVSIVFSTLSIIAGFYAAVISWPIIKKSATISSYFIIASLLYLVVSAIGPFATGPLIVTGKAGTPLYFNAIYFYLHFQYNGFFSFVVFAVIYRMLETKTSRHNGKKVFWLMNLGCTPAYFLSILWNKPAFVFYTIGGIGAVIQLVGLYFLLKDVKLIGWKREMSGWLFRLSITALVIKCLLQASSSIPIVADLAYLNRNFIIAYLHLVLIGFISLFVFGVIAERRNRLMNVGIGIFLLAFLTTELLLVLQGQVLLFSSKNYLKLLFGISSLFPVGVMMILSSVPRRSRIFEQITQI